MLSVLIASIFRRVLLEESFIDHFLPLIFIKGKASYSTPVHASKSYFSDIALLNRFVRGKLGDTILKDSRCVTFHHRYSTTCHICTATTTVPEKKRV